MSEALALDAFEYLLELEQRVLLIDRHNSEDPSDDIEFIHFRSGGFDFLIPIQNSSEILFGLAHARIPGSQSWLYGLANNRGKILTLIDLSAYFSHALQTGSSNKRVIVVEYDRCTYGLIVDQIVGIVHSLKLEEVDLDLDAYPDKLNNIVVQDYKCGSTRFGMLDLNQLLDQIQHTLH